MGMGKCIKMVAIYKRNGQWWRKYNLQGDIVACGGLPPNLSVNIKADFDYNAATAYNNNKNGASSETNEEKKDDEKKDEEEKEEQLPLFTYCFDITPKSQKYGVLCCLVEGRLYEYFHDLSFEKQKELMTEFLKLSFEDYVPIRNNGEQDDDDGTENQPLWMPDDFFVYDWVPDSVDKYVLGAYNGYFKPDVMSQPKYWHAFRQVEKSPNLFWAGTDYHAGFGNGYIEGAIRSGQLAADLIKNRLELLFRQ